MYQQKRKLNPKKNDSLYHFYSIYSRIFNNPAWSGHLEDEPQSYPIFWKGHPTPRGDVMHARDVCRNLPKYGIGDGWYFSWLKKYPHQNGWKSSQFLMVKIEKTLWNHNDEASFTRGYKVPWQLWDGMNPRLVVSHKGFLSLWGLLSGGCLLATTLVIFVAPKTRMQVTLGAFHLICICLNCHHLWSVLWSRERGHQSWLCIQAIPCSGWGNITRHDYLRANWAQKSGLVGLM